MSITFSGLMQERGRGGSSRIEELCVVGNVRELVGGAGWREWVTIVDLDGCDCE